MLAGDQKFFHEFYWSDFDSNHSDQLLSMIQAYRRHSFVTVVVLVISRTIYPFELRFYVE